MEYFTTNCYTGIVGTFVCFLHFFLLPTYKIADIIEETANTPKANLNDIKYVTGE